MTIKRISYTLIAYLKIIFIELRDISTKTGKLYTVVSCQHHNQYNNNCPFFPPIPKRADFHEDLFLQKLHFHKSKPATVLKRCQMGLRNENNCPFFVMFMILQNFIYGDSLILIVERKAPQRQEICKGEMYDIIA